MADAKVKHPRFVELHLGPAPVEEINLTFQLELKEGIVVFSAAAQKHDYKRHPKDFQDFLAYAGVIVSSPGYIGQAPKHADKIELVRRLPPSKGAAGLLVAVVLEPDASGRYHVASFYSVSEAKISNRRQSGTLKVPRKNKGLVSPRGPKALPGCQVPESLPGRPVLYPLPLAAVGA